MFINPGTVGVFIALIFFLTSLKLPQPIYDTLEYLGSLNTPMPMFIIGASMLGMSLKQLICQWKIYLPILIIDSANQPMGIEIFKEVYPTITQLADSIGVQTIFMSKDRLDNIPEDDFIDISAGLNKFHKKS